MLRCTDYLQLLNSVVSFILTSNEVFHKFALSSLGKAQEAKGNHGVIGKGASQF